MKTKLIRLYLDYKNNFTSLASFAAYHELNIVNAQRIINIGCKLAVRMFDRIHTQRCKDMFSNMV